MSVDEAEAAMPDMPPGVELYSAAQVQDSAWGRVLLIGPKQSGKTVSLANTLPKPLVINCDGWASMRGAAKLGGKNPQWKSIDVNCERDWMPAVVASERLVSASIIRSVVLDTATCLVDNLADEYKARGMKGWDLWGEVNDTVLEGCKRLANLNAHFFVVCHMQTSDYDGSAGILPLIGGQLKQRLPRLLDDWILFNVDPTAVPPASKRRFILGCHGSWIASGRNIKSEKILPADPIAYPKAATDLLIELGATP